jgi:hydroxymethylpyrimidine pyrophosphatase-like HAD family hydrolase
MERYLKAAGIAREDSIAVGDGPNDLQMMEYAGIGIAMGNAREVKERADMVTSSIDDDGIYRAFETLGLLA